MSGSLALGCGGLSKEDDPTADDAEEDGAGGTASSGGVAAGSGGASTGGNTNGGGTGGSASGGTPSGGNTAAGGENLGGASPMDCPTEQLSCPSNRDSVCAGDFRRLPADCTCDPGLPAEPSDCSEGEQLMCLGALADSSGQDFDDPIAYDCECVPIPLSGDCVDSCAIHAAVGISDTQCAEPGEITDDLDMVLCGCSVTILK